MTTIEADIELKILRNEQSKNRNDSQEVFSRMQKYPYNSYERKGLQNENRKIDTKYYKVEERISEIENIGLSSRQMSSLKRELGSFIALQHSINMGTRDRTVIGFSKTLKSYVIISYTKFTDFMRNVQGMGSLAGTKSLRSVRFISERQYSQITNQQKTPRRQKFKRTQAQTNFGGVFG